MNTQRMLQVALFALIIPSAAAQSGPLIYLPTQQFPGSEVTTSGLLVLEAESPGSQPPPAQVNLLDMQEIELGDALELRKSGSFGQVLQGGGQMTNPNGCDFSGTYCIEPLVGAPEPGFGYTVFGTTDLISVRTHSHFRVNLTTASAASGQLSGPDSATTSAALSTAETFTVNVPFAVRLSGFTASVFTQRTFLFRGDGTLDGSSGLDWRIVEDTDGNGVPSPGEATVFSAMPPLLSTSPVRFVFGAAATSGVLPIGRYVLEVKYDHSQMGSTSVNCNEVLNEFSELPGRDRSGAQVTLTLD